MDEILKKGIINKFGGPVNSPKDCDILSREILTYAERNISATTLRRLFGLLPSKTSISAYNLDTLAIYCGSSDYPNFVAENKITETEDNSQFDEFKPWIKQITDYTLNSISRNSLAGFQNTIPRLDLNGKLNDFLDS